MKCPSRRRLQSGLKLWFPPQTQGGGVQRIFLIMASRARQRGDNCPLCPTLCPTLYPWSLTFDQCVCLFRQNPLHNAPNKTNKTKLQTIVYFMVINFTHVKISILFHISITMSTIIHAKMHIYKLIAQYKMSIRITNHSLIHMQYFFINFNTYFIYWLYCAMTCAKAKWTKQFEIYIHE